MHTTSAQGGEKKDTFEEWPRHGKGEGTVTDEFRRYSIAGSAVPVIGVLESAVEQ
jgi:hypothetical protein